MKLLSIITSSDRLNNTIVTHSKYVRMIIYVVYISINMTVKITFLKCVKMTFKKYVKIT